MHSPALTWGLPISRFICAGALPPRSLCCGLLSHCCSRPGMRQVSPPTPDSQDPQEKMWIATYSPTGSPCKEHPLEAEGGPSFLFPCSEGSRFHQEQRSFYRFPGMLVPKSPCQRDCDPAHPSSSSLRLHPSALCSPSTFPCPGLCPYNGWLVGQFSECPTLHTRSVGREGTSVKGFVGTNSPPACHMGSPCAEPLSRRDPEP